MNHMKPLTVLCVILFVFTVSCKKNHTPAPVVQTPLDSFQLNLNFPLARNTIPYGYPSSYELIISEGSGRVVLDTVTGFNAPVITWLKTNQKLLDVTIVSGGYNGFTASVHSYKAIDLTSWVNMPDNDSIQIAPGGAAPPSPVAGIVTYTGVNLPLGSYYDFLAYATGSNGQVYSNTVYGQFNAPLGDYGYLIFPDLGLYNLHQLVSQNDVVDFSHPDTAVRVPFNTPAGYTTTGFSIAGYPDTTRLGNTVNLTYYDRNGQFITDATGLLYPGAKGFKKYYFSYYASNANNGDGVNVNLPYIDTIPNNFPIPDASWYGITKTADTGVSVQFLRSSPTYYNIVSTLANGYQFTLTAPADSTLLHPVSFYRSLKSKFLGNLDFSQMQFTYVYMMHDVQPDYRAYWVEHSQIYQLWVNPTSANTTFQHPF